MESGKNGFLVLFCKEICKIFQSGGRANPPEGIAASSTPFPLGGRPGGAASGRCRTGSRERGCSVKMDKQVLSSTDIGQGFGRGKSVIGNFLHDRDHDCTKKSKKFSPPDQNEPHE